MSNCPEKECNELVREHTHLINDLIRGVDKKADKICLTKYLKKPPLAVVVGIIIGLFLPSVLAIANIWKDQEIATHLYVKKEVFQTQHSKITKMEADLNTLRRIVENFQSEFNQQKIDTRIRLEEIKYLIGLIEKQTKDK